MQLPCYQAFQSPVRLLCGRAACHHITFWSRIEVATKWSFKNQSSGVMHCSHHDAKGYKFEYRKIMHRLSLAQAVAVHRLENPKFARSYCALRSKEIEWLWLSLEVLDIILVITQQLDVINSNTTALYTLLFER